jgi:hypothetical protein
MPTGTKADSTHTPNFFDSVFNSDINGHPLPSMVSLGCTQLALVWRGPNLICTICYAPEHSSVRNFHAS